MILSAAKLALIGAMLHFLPSWTRPDLFFAVTVEPAFRKTEAAGRILLRYRLVVWISVIAAIAFTPILGQWAAAIQVAGFVCALADAHRRTRAHAVPRSTTVEVDLSTPAEKFPGGPLLIFLPIVFLSALALWADRHWDDLPRRIVVHWGLNGADRWIARTHGAVAGMLALDAAVSLLFALFAWGIFHWSRRSLVKGSRGLDERRFRRRTAQMLLLVSWFPVVQAWIALLRPPAFAVWFLVAGTIAFALLLIAVVRYRQGPDDRAPDSCWKLGATYYNPADPAIFVPQRFGIGYTLNFGNRWSWVLLAAVLLPVLFTRLFLR